MILSWNLIVWLIEKAGPGTAADGQGKGDGTYSPVAGEGAVRHLERRGSRKSAVRKSLYGPTFSDRLQMQHWQEGRSVEFAPICQTSSLAQQ